jgi:hypothetical protein
MQTHQHYPLWIVNIAGRAFIALLHQTRLVWQLALAGADCSKRRKETAGSILTWPAENQLCAGAASDASHGLWQWLQSHTLLWSA